MRIDFHRTIEKIGENLLGAMYDRIVSCSAPKRILGAVSVSQIDSADCLMILELLPGLKALTGTVEEQLVPQMFAVHIQEILSSIS